MTTMTNTVTFSPLSLDLPNSRMSVDFTKFATTPSFSQPKQQTTIVRTNKPSPLNYSTVQRRPIPQRQRLPELKEEQESDSFDASRAAFNWPWNASAPDQSGEPELYFIEGKVQHIVLRTKSNASSASLRSAVSSISASSASTTSSRSTASSISASSTTTAASSIFSSNRSTSTGFTTYSSLPSVYSVAKVPKSKSTPTLSSLPLSILELILSYVLNLPMTVAVGPENAGLRHMQYRYHRSGLDYVDIGLLLKHPTFSISKHIRSVSLDIVHRKCTFVIDLHRIYHTKVSSTINDNLKTHKKFWMGDTPHVVKNVLCNATKLHIRLPVPSTEASAHRGRDEDDWMDGSDGKGGGSWRVKSFKREQEDALDVRKYVRAIKDLIMTDPKPRSGTKEAKAGISLNIMKGRRGPEKANENHSLQGLGADDDAGTKRKPLKRIEIVLVKRSPYATVLPEVLSLVGELRPIPVAGYTNYFFELEGQRLPWATRYRKKWQGMRPDGQRLYKDLQALSIAEKPIEPICTPTEFKFVNVNDGKLQLSDSAMPKTPITLERRKPADRTVQAAPVSPVKKRKPLGFNWNVNHKRQDSFDIVMEKGMKESGTTQGGISLFSKRKQPPPPSVEELQKIADDIRNGLY